MVKPTLPSEIRNELSPLKNLTCLVNAYKTAQTQQGKDRVIEAILHQNETAQMSIDKIIRIANRYDQKFGNSEIDFSQLEEGIPVLATYGLNTVLKKPFKFLYEFGYITKHGCVVYTKGERSM